jgi:hypothetical protein
MNNADHIFRAQKPFFAFFGVKILKFFDEDPGWRQVGSGINIPDPPHWFLGLPDPDPLVRDMDPVL